MTHERQAVRALVIDRAERLLLFRGVLRDREPWWFAPGGGVEPGESDETAIARELMEETRLQVDVTTLGAPVWTRDYIFRWEGKDERHLERFFLIRVDEPAIDTTGLEPAEAGVVREYRWWPLDEISRSLEKFSPSRLATLLAPLLEGQLPMKPISVGE